MPGLRWAHHAAGRQRWRHSAGSRPGNQTGADLQIGPQDFACSGSTACSASPVAGGVARPEHRRQGRPALGSAATWRPTQASLRRGTDGANDAAQREVFEQVGFAVAGPPVWHNVPAGRDAASCRGAEGSVQAGLLQGCRSGGRASTGDAARELARAGFLCCISPTAHFSPRSFSSGRN